jgi:hypothetical protein
MGLLVMAMAVVRSSLGTDNNVRGLLTGDPQTYMPLFLPSPPGRGSATAAAPPPAPSP